MKRPHKDNQSANDKRLRSSYNPNHGENNQFHTLITEIRGLRYVLKCYKIKNKSFIILLCYIFESFYFNTTLSV